MDKKNVPEIRFKGFSGDWERKKLGDCLLVQRGGSPRPIENYITDSDDGINWIKIGDVAVDSRYITSTQEKIKPEGEKKSRRVFLGDLILSNSMSFGRPYIMQIEGCIHDGWLLIRDENRHFDVEYLLQLLSSDYMAQQYKSLASGGVVNNLNSELVQSSTILMPPIAEQSLIGNFFRNLDQLITLQQRKYEKLGTLKKACLDKMFPRDGAHVPEVRFAGFSGDWERKKLGEVAEYKNGKGNENKQSSQGRYELINLNSVSINGGLKPSGKYIDEASETLKSNDLVMILSDIGHGDLLGRVALIPVNNKFVLNQRVALLRPNGFVNPLFLFSYINLHQKYFKGQGAGMSQLNISRGSVESFADYIPNISEQTAIGNFFKTLDSLMTGEANKLEKLKTIKKSMLDKMFI